jgi:hypothetical protein
VKISAIRKASHKAAQDTASFMTHQLRQSALQHGWDKDVAENTHVEYGSGKFTVKVHPDYSSRAFVHEYGSETQRPTAVIRKYVNDTSVAQGALISQMNEHYKAAK